MGANRDLGQALAWCLAHKDRCHGCLLFFSFLFPALLTNLEDTSCLKILLHTICQGIHAGAPPHYPQPPLTHPRQTAWNFPQTQTMPNLGYSGHRPFSFNPLPQPLPCSTGRASDPSCTNLLLFFSIASSPSHILENLLLALLFFSVPYLPLFAYSPCSSLPL